MASDSQMGPLLRYGRRQALTTCNKPNNITTTVHDKAAYIQSHVSYGEESATEFCSDPITFSEDYFSLLNCCYCNILVSTSLPFIQHFCSCWQEMRPKWHPIPPIAHYFGPGPIGR